MLQAMWSSGSRPRMILAAPTGFGRTRALEIARLEHSGLRRPLPPTTMVQGDVEIFMQATGEPGWHFIDLYPAIYKGKETRPVNYRLPQLTAEQDHPGEDLPVFHFAFEVTPPGTRVSGSE